MPVLHVATKAAQRMLVCPRACCGGCWCAGTVVLWLAALGAIPARPVGCGRWRWGECAAVAAIPAACSHVVCAANLAGSMRACDVCVSWMAARGGGTLKLAARAAAGGLHRRCAGALGVLCAQNRVVVGISGWMGVLPSGMGGWGRGWRQRAAQLPCVTAFASRCVLLPCRAWPTGLARTRPGCAAPRPSGDWRGAHAAADSRRF